MPSVEVARQPLEAPLSDKAKEQLAALQRKYKKAQNTQLDHHLRGASQYLADAVNPVNLAKVERRRKLESLKEREKNNANDPMGPEELAEREAEVAAFEARVNTVTQKMDEAIRNVIDQRVWHEELDNSLKHITSRNTGAQATQRTTQRSILPTQDATPRGQLEEDEEADDQQPDQGPPENEDTPVPLLQAALTTQTTRHNIKPLTDRYAHDNDYAGFYKSRHDGLHSHEDPPAPVPPPALWFGAEEGNALTVNYDDDKNLEVIGERVSLKCVLTLNYFEDPVTSDVCGHSYEKTAILDLLKHSDDRLPYTAEQEVNLAAAARNQKERLARQYRVPRAKCPVAGCDSLFAEKDLRPDHTLRTKAARQKKKEEDQRARDELDEDDLDDDDEDEDVIAGTQRAPHRLGSSSPVAQRNRDSNARKIKMEMAKQGGSDDEEDDEDDVQVPSSQPRRRPPPRSQPFEMSDDEEDDDASDEVINS